MRVIECNRCQRIFSHFYHSLNRADLEGPEVDLARQNAGRQQIQTRLTESGPLNIAYLCRTCRCDTRHLASQGLMATPSHLHPYPAFNSGRPFTYGTQDLAIIRLCALWRPGSLLGSQFKPIRRPLAFRIAQQSKMPTLTGPKGPVW